MLHGIWIPEICEYNDICFQNNIRWIIKRRGIICLLVQITICVEWVAIKWGLFAKNSFITFVFNLSSFKYGSFVAFFKYLRRICIGVPWGNFLCEVIFHFDFFSLTTKVKWNITRIRLFNFISEFAFLLLLLCRVYIPKEFNLKISR